MNENFSLEPSTEPVTTPPTESGVADDIAEGEVAVADENDENGADASTGLVWPRTWKGAYVLVLCSFVLWVVSLIAVSEVFK